MMDIYELSEADIAMLASMLKRATEQGQRVRVAWHEPKGLMLKVGGGMWTHPMGEHEQQ